MCFRLWASQTETVLNCAKFCGGFVMWTTASWCYAPFIIFSSKQREGKQKLKYFVTLTFLACSSSPYATQLHLLLFLTDLQSRDILYTMPEDTTVIKAVVIRSGGLRKTRGWITCKKRFGYSPVFKFM